MTFFGELMVRTLSGISELRLSADAAVIRVGRTMIERKRFDDADKVFERALAKAPDDPRLLVEYALSANDSGRFRLAWQRWERARAAAPDLPIAWLGAVVNARHLGMWDWAEPVIAQAARRFPTDETIGREAASFARPCKIVCCVKCTSHHVSGWAAEEPLTRQIILAIFVNGRRQGSVAPWLDRPDVQAAIGNPGYGFYFEFPERLRDGDVVSIRDPNGQTVAGYPGASDTRGLCNITYSIPPLGSSADNLITRASIAKHFLGGDGVEIGAFMMPTDISADHNVLYYDRFPLEILRTFDPSPQLPIINPSLLGEAETLDGLADASFDFLIANHVIEHLRDPIRFLENVARALRSGGRALIVAPDKRYTFDRRRPITSFAHLVEDHVKGPMAGEHDHLFEYATLVDGRSDKDALEWIARRGENQMPIHYHVWDAKAFVDFIGAAVERFEIPLRLIYVDDRTQETDVVLEKTAVPLAA